MSNNLFSGNSTYGVSIQVGISESGEQYWRDYSWNGYGKGWTKWKKLDSKCSFNEKGNLVWGWNEFTGCRTKLKLPKEVSNEQI